MLYAITTTAIEDYITDLVPPRSPVLAELEARAHQQGLALVGPVEGTFLYLLARSVGAREALEVGTTTGYEAIWLLQALTASGGRLTAVESRPERVNLAREFLEKAGYTNDVTLHHAEWMTLLPKLTGPYDLIFLDILRSLTSDAESLQALDLCLPLLRPGGLLVSDNVLCSAQVLEDNAPPTVRGIQKFNERIMSHPELESVILPIRDGIAISRKKEA